MAKYKPIPVAPFLKGLNLAADVYTQPKGTFPRGSNLLLNKRGALDVCDGTQIIHALGGFVQTGKGKNTCNFLFAPTGVSRYYLALIKVLDLPLGPPKNLVAADGGAGGTLAPGTYYYKVTALDGAGGETTASNEASVTIAANHKVTLTWNVVPNAVYYNIYRGTVSNAESVLVSASLPVSQPSLGNLTVTFTDDGSASGAAVPLAITQIQKNSYPPNVNVIMTLAAPNPGYGAGAIFVVSGGSNATFNATYQVLSSPTSTTLLCSGPFAISGLPYGTTSTGGTATFLTSPPVVDTTQQTALFKMPVIVGNNATLPVPYTYGGNIVALYPADLPILPDGGGGGGSGGGGGTGGGGSTGGGVTPSGGVAGTVSLLPQIVQFTNRAVIALGNGYPPQLFSDPSTPTNPATTSKISAISVDAFGVVTVTTATPHGLSTSQSGSNVQISGVANTVYNQVGPTLQVVSTTQFKIRNLTAIGAGADSTGTVTTTSVSITSTFIPAFPTWATAIQFNTNTVVTPTVSNGHYYIAKQGGVTGNVQPTWPTVTGAQVSDGSVIWQEAGLTNTAAPPPPGAGHVTVYAGSLWIFNTSPTNTSTGIDGPCSLRMSDVNNPNSWNPINQAFLDKDDGTEGTGITAFTISAQGIPPQGSLVAYKNYASYQIVGVFGSTNLTIQRVKSDLGCIAPRTLMFVPGFGIGRFCHLGFAIFDGVEDRIISEEIRPLLFPTLDFAESDLVTLDASSQSLMWSAMTSNPPMWCTAIPVGNSGGQLTVILCYDLVLKAWAAPINLPFAIATMSQFKTISANAVTILGGFSDGCLSRWQAGDQMWDVGAQGARGPSQVAWSVKAPDVAAQDTSEKLNCRRLAIRGISTSAVSPVQVTLYVNGAAQPFPQPYPIPASGDFEVFASFMTDGLRFSAKVSGSGQLEIDRLVFHVSGKPVGAAAVIA